jgi:isopentenyl-diphosphate delta-isomerase
MTIEKRKRDHIDICLNKQIETGSTGFEDIQLIHNALPELDVDDIDTNIKFLGKILRAPIIVSAMTGGTVRAKKINKNIASACQELGLGMGLGSQRAGLEDDKLVSSYQVRSVAKDILLIGNIGVTHATLENAQKCVDMIDADALAIHLNALQEVCQKDGDKNGFVDGIKRIKMITKKLNKPVIVKETGAGIGMEVSKRMKNIIDVSGYGGSSWSLVESYRGGSNLDWGIPTAVSLLETKGRKIASGGIRTGLDCAKAIALGADVCGIALPLLKPATRGKAAVVVELEKIINELKMVMFLTGSRNIKQLKKKPVVITGFVRQWCEARGIDVQSFAMR